MNGYVLLLHTDKDEGEEYMLYSYPHTSMRIKQFQKLKGVFLACSGVTSTILGEPAKIFSFKINERNEENRYGAIGNLKFQSKVKAKDMMHNSQGYYKAAFGCSEINKLLVTVILPSSYPDQVCIYAAEECKNFIETFYTHSLIYFLENEELQIKEEDEKENEGEGADPVNEQLKQKKKEKKEEEYATKRKAALEKLDSIFDTVFYQLIPFSSKLEDFERSPIGSPQIISSILGFHPDNKCPSLASLELSEKLEIDLSEITNALNDDQTNILSAFDPTTQIEGAILMYKGYTVFNQLEKVYLEPVGRVIMLYNLFEHDSSRAERGVVEVVQVDKKYAHKLDMPHTLLDDHNEFTNDNKEVIEDELLFEESKENVEDSSRPSNLGDPFLNLYSKEKYENAKRKDKIAESEGKVKKIVVAIARGEMVLAVVLHIVFKFYGGEYDPLYVERVKQTLFMLYDEKLTNIIDQNFHDSSLSTPYHSAKFMNSAPPIHMRVPKKSSSKRGIEGSKDKVDENLKNVFDQPRVSLVRSSELLSHDIIQNKSITNINQRISENSSIADHSLGIDEEEKASMNMTMKSPLDPQDFANRGRNNSAERSVTQKHSQFKRSNSAARNSRESARGRGIGELMKINPISLPLSKGKLYHYLMLNENIGQNINPPIKASPNWFGQVYKSIFRTYCYLNPVLNISDIFKKDPQKHTSERIREALISDSQNGNEYIFEDIMACVREYDVESHDILEQKEQFSSLNKLLKIKEIGSQVRIPISNVFNQEPYSNFWVVASTAAINKDPDEGSMLIQYDEEPYNRDLESEREEYTTNFVAYDNTQVVESRSVLLSPKRGKDLRMNVKNPPLPSQILNAFKYRLEI
ncbi:unnamed protein product [Moneuplotes crassus]|uniref:Uncharacterized protein n=1 Tax=Euplotes crassus TaxID=5936 RepID=A0AAD1Y0I9_EUPCR|nr:unnamed protein product [Moneuplotes crassus]